MWAAPCDYKGEKELRTSSLDSPPHDCVGTVEPDASSFW